METSLKKHRPDLIRFVFAGALLVIIPMLCSLLLILHIIEGQKEMAHRTAAAQIEARARDLFASLDAGAFFTPRFQKMAETMLPLLEHLTHEVSTARADSLQKLQNCYKQTAAGVGQDFHLFVFDSAGELVDIGLAPEKSKAPMQYLWRALHKEPGINRHGRRPEIAHILGKEFRITTAEKENDRCLPTDNFGIAGLLYHRRMESAKFGVIAFVELSSDSRAVFSDMANRLNSHETPVLLSPATDNPAGEKSVFPVAELFTRTDSDEQGVFFHANYLWKKFSGGAAPVLIGQPFSPSIFLLLRLLTIFAAILCTGIGLTHLYRSFFSQKTVWMSIRIKLVGIFLFAVYLPILGLFMLGYNGLQDRRTVLENEARRGILDLLLEIDSGFVKKERQIHAAFEAFYRNTGWKSSLNKGYDELNNAVRLYNGSKPGEDNFFNWFDMRDIHQNQLYSSSIGEANDRIKAMGRTMSLISLEKVMPQRLQQAGVKLRQSDLVLVNLLENPILGFSNFFEQPGRLLPMDFEGSRLYWYWNYYDAPDSPVAYIGGNTTAQNNIVRYMHETLKKRYSLDSTALKLAAFMPAENLWFGVEPTAEDKLKNLFRVSMRSARVEEAVINFQGGEYLATCLPGVKLHRFYLACLFPLAEIDVSIENLRSQIYSGVAFILIIAVLTGLLLSKTFLQPIAEIDLGLQALRRRDTDFRLMIENQDELGELGQTFNQMMVEIKEMLLAGAVQQCLISSECPKIEGFESLIYNRMAADVGGDYADMFELPDRRYLIVLGDVTGHGVSSSILTAMVKAAVFRFATHDTDLKTILQSLSSMIFELLQRRKLMTFCAIILDSRNGRFYTANAGHPFPLLCSPDGRIRQIEHASLPLGVSLKRSTYEVVEGELAPGEMLMLYTDGITEGTDASGCEFGLERVEKIISASLSNGVEAVRDRLLEDFFRHYQRQELDDDLTFILVRHLPAAAEAPE